MTTTPTLTFAAIDVETANRARGSICEIGVTVVRDGVVESSRSWRCQPPEALSGFDYWNVSIHGITAADVAQEPTFAERMVEVTAVIGDLPVIAHNAGFDIGAIRSACDHSGIERPTWAYGCTLVWSRKLLDLVSNRLPIVVEALGLPFGNHHAAADDSAAAAAIALSLASRVGAGSIAELAEASGSRLGLLSPASSVGCRVRQTSRGGGGTLIAAQVASDADPDHPLYGETVVLTLKLSSMTRQEVWNEVARFGATAEDTVTKRTTRLVVGGGFSGLSLTEFTSGKLAAAVKKRAAGQLIEVLTEQDLLELIAE